jgi:hypothetical protein
MAKKSNQSVPKQAVRRPVASVKSNQEYIPEQVTVEKDSYIPEWLYQFKIQAIIVGIIAFVLYVNTSSHEYALDDTIVIVKNEYVHQGFGGIDDILTKDAFDSYYKQFNSSNQLAGGRYRPLSIITFALEQQLFGALKEGEVDSFITYGMSFDMKTPAEKRFLKQMHIRHFINVLLYTLSVIVLLYFLRRVVFRSNPILAFLATLIFAIHPLHTEVVANVKSRDEIMSLLFISLTFIYAFKYQENKKTGTLIWALVCYLLAFLSKEYAITLIVLIPLALHFFNKYPISQCVKATLPFVGTFVLYWAWRQYVTDPMSAASDSDILNNPYAYADPAQKFATQVSTSLNYFKLLIFPHPLTADYSYNTIPYKDFSSAIFWLSLMVHAATIWLFFFLYKKKHYILAFGIAFFLSHLLLVNNFVFNIGATMGERLVYHSSVGFAMILAWLLYQGMLRIKPAMAGRGALAAIMVVLVLVCGYTTIARNAYWKNDQTLFDHDITISPNSVLVNANVASTLVNKADTETDEKKKNEALRKGIEYYNKTISIHNTFVSGYMNRGVAYMKLNMPDSAKADYDKVFQLYPNYPSRHEIYYNLGVCFYMNQKVQQAIAIWAEVAKLKPDYVVAQQSINTALQAMNAAAQPQQNPTATPAQPGNTAQPVQTPQATPAQK